MNIATVVSVFTRALAMTTLMAWASGVFAGEFFEHDGVAIRGYDPVAYFTQGAAVKGLPALAADYKGSTFHFSSPANRDAFKADAARYAPQYGGFCAFGTAGGYKAAIEPAAFTVVDGKLYLNYNRDVQRQWSRDIAGYVKSADRKWPEVSRQAKVVP